MDFLLADFQQDLASSIDALLTKADVPALARAWVAGDRDITAAVYGQLAETGVFGLLIDDADGGAGAGAVEMVVAMEQIGRHGLPGPMAESVAAVPVLLRDAGLTDRLGSVAAGRISTLATPPLHPRAADTDLAADIYLLDGGVLSTASAVAVEATVDPTRIVSPVDPVTALAHGIDPRAVIDIAALATAAQLLGLGRQMLAIASDYAQARKQFGRAIGSFQAVKHHLADVAVGLEMAAPLIHGAAVGVDGGAPDGTDVSRDISAAKVAAADAAYLAARHALQVLGAIGYTREHDLSIYLTRTRALIGAWGTPADHRQRILDTLRDRAS